LPSLGGDVVGPASSTDNAIARFDSTTGKLLQNSVVTIGDTGAATGFTTLSASTSVSTPIVKATSSAGGALQNSSGTNQLQWGGGGGNNLSVDVAININPANAQVAISPTGTGSVTINPATAGTINNMSLGATTASTAVVTTLTANTSVSTDTISEKTSAAGVTIDGVLLKDNAVSASSGFTQNSTFNSASTMGFKNRIINGAMVIDQRNAGASYTLTSSQTYTLDRFFGAEDTDGVMTVQQSSTAPTGFNFSALCTATTADASLGSTQHVYLGQKIEGFNTADLGWGTANAQTVTLSFWVRSSLTGTFGGSITNSAFSRSYPFSYTISSANTWEQKSVTIAGDTTGTWVGATNGAGIQLLFGLGVGSSFSGTAGAWAAAGLMSVTGAVSVIGTLNANWYITGVQLEKGSTATNFDYRPYGTELNLCQRYYYKAITGTLFNQLAFCNVRTTTSHYAFLQLPVTMRANPTSVDYSGVGIIAAWGAGVTGLNSLTLADAAYGTGQTQVLLNAVTSGAVGTVGQVSMLLGNNSTTGFVALNAEL
jgi:hypothetical protein